MEEHGRPTKMRKLSHEGRSSVTGDQPSLETSAGADITSKPGNEQTSTGNETISNEKVAAENDQTMNGNENAEESLPAPDDVAPSAPPGDQATGDPPLSKSQQKKLRKKAEWESKAGERKMIRKEKLTAKRERKREAKQKEIEENGGVEPVKEKKPLPPRAIQLPVTFLFDCNFDELMRDNERISLASQITRCYSDNKNALFRAHLAIASFGGHLRERFEKVLTHHKQWRGVRWLEEDFVESAEKAKEWMVEGEAGGELAGTFSSLAGLDQDAQQKLKDEGEIIYLSSEADDTLTELKPYSTYIIGGLVDKNREKGICHRRATAAGVRTAKLPIGDYLQMQSRKVLTTNHVNEIMIKWLECGDWGEAFMKVIPKRKGGTLRSASEEAEKNDEAQEGDENVDDDEEALDGEANEAKEEVEAQATE